MYEEAIGKGVRYAFRHTEAGGDGQTAHGSIVIAMPKGIKDFTYAYSLDDGQGDFEVEISISSQRAVELGSAHFISAATLTASALATISKGATAVKITPAAGIKAYTFEMQVCDDD